MSRKKIENKIERLEQDNSDIRETYFVSEEPDGTLIDRKTGKPIDSIEMPDNSIIMTISDKTYSSWTDN